MIGDGEQVAVAPVREHRTRPSARLVSDLCANDPARCLGSGNHPLRFQFEYDLLRAQSGTSGLDRSRSGQEPIT